MLFHKLLGVSAASVFDHQYLITNPANNVSTVFGNSLYISNGKLFVGDSDDDGGIGGKFHAFDIANGSLLYTVENPNASGTSTGDQFGTKITASANYVVVGAPYEDRGSNTSVGVVYVFDSANGNLVHTIQSPNTFSSTFFGNRGISLNDTHICIGSFIRNISYMFSLSDGSLYKTIINPDLHEGSGDNFGWDTDIDSNHMIISARRERSSLPSGNSSSGAVHVYTSNGEYISSIENPYPEATFSTDLFGNKIKLNNEYLVIGSYENEGEGKAYLYNITNNSLIEEYSRNTGSDFSTTLGLSNNFVIVGSDGDALNPTIPTINVYGYNSATPLQSFSDDIQYGISFAENYLAFNTPDGVEVYKNTKRPE